ncbi:hypothetical protein ACIBCT_22685 [Streptosporangium sp. NPDC050855]|uniref:hypothetical protein n=1 Tax=Streptosporangium sp. NPDC050855 TaxID=3366194 RepID=UPI00378BB738
MPGIDEQERGLAAGTAIYTKDGHPVLRTSSGEFLDLNIDLKGGLGDLPERAVLAFEERGLLAAPAGAPERTVLVVGDGLIATALHDLLRQAGFVTRTARPDEALTNVVPGRTVLTWCCDDLPPPDWEPFGVAAVQAGAVWQRCSVEGATAVLEPLTLTGADLSHSHVRARRLAASESPDHLAAYWTARPEHASTAVGTIEAHLVAGLLAADLAVLEAGRPRTRTLRMVDLLTQRVSDHPILPLPAFHPRPERR